MFASSAEGLFQSGRMSDRQKTAGEGLPRDRPCRPRTLRRRSSIQKIIHMCNQSYQQVFPHVFLWVQIHFHRRSIQEDVRKVIPMVRGVVALRCGVYLSIALLSAELLYCLVAALTAVVPSGSAFFFVCIGILSAIALEIFDVALGVRKTLRGSFFVKRKKLC